MNYTNDQLLKPTYQIRTNYGDIYTTNSIGQVLTYSNGYNIKNYNYAERSLFDNLNAWVIRGIVKLLPFGNVSSIIPLENACKIDNFRYKNGKPCYTVVDIDHGTTRLTGNTPCHGTVSVINLK